YRGRPRDGAGAHRVEDLLAFPMKQRPRAGELEENDARRVDVGAAVDGHPPRLLRRHVRELALDDAFLLLDVARAGDAEIGELDRPVPRDEDVLRRNVTVDDALLLAVLIGLAMGVVEPATDLLHHVRREAVGHAPADLRSLLQEPEEVDA